MSKFNTAMLVSSCMALNSSRFQQAKEDHELYTQAVIAASNIFSSLADIQDNVEAELIYLEKESTFSRPSNENSFANAIQSYHYAMRTLQIIMNEPEMYIKYCVPVCSSVKTNDKNGIPKDAFRNALASHKARLQNYERAHGITNEDSGLYILRLKNITKALKLYKELQKQVLGL